MTPILVRPVREQLEHDRVIRLLQARWRRKYLVAINAGADQLASVTAGELVLYPDLILTPPGGRRPAVVVEVETGESVNNLEALAEWVRLARTRAEFHLYVPAGSVDVARRLCEAHSIPVAEICSYHPIGDQMRWVTVYKDPTAARSAARREAAAARKSAPHGASKPAPSRKPAARKPTTGAAKRSPRPKKAAAKPSRSQKRR